MNRLSTEKRAKIIQLLVEGNSLRSTARIADCSLTTVIKLLEETGPKCGAFQDELLKNLPCKLIQVDEIWSFIKTTRNNTPVERREENGDIWTWTSICSETKLVPHWLVGTRESIYAEQFIRELAERIDGRFQLSADGFQGYRGATSGLDIDFGRIVKEYAKPQGQRFGAFKGQARESFSGNPDPEKISTTHVERQNLTMRTCISRFGRKTNAFSKKLANHKAAVDLHFAHYNFVRIHRSLRVTPAMAAGITDRLWNYEDLASL